MEKETERLQKCGKRQLAKHRRGPRRKKAKGNQDAHMKGAASPVGTARMARQNLS